MACLIANAHRDPKKRRRPYRIEDFMPGSGASEQSAEQQAAILLFASRASRRQRRR